MSIEHNAIADPDIHEPKGIATANSGEIYISDGASGGSWTALHRGVFYSVVTQTALATTWTDVALELEGVKSGLIHSTVTNSEKITVGQTGTYQISYSLMADSASATTIVEGRLLVGGVEIPGSAAGAEILTAEGQVITSTIIDTLTLNEVLKLQFYGSTANGRLINPGAGATAAVSAILTVSQLVA